MNKSWIVIVLFMMTLQSCAFLLGGATPENIYIKQGVPQNADVYYLGNKIGKAPLELFVPKTAYLNPTNRIEIKAEGYAPLVIPIKKRVRPVFFVLDCLTLGIPLIVDYKTGKIWRPTPQRVSYRLSAIGN